MSAILHPSDSDRNRLSMSEYVPDDVSGEFGESAKVKIPWLPQVNQGIG
jgi:hypothetical protein